MQATEDEAGSFDMQSSGLSLFALGVWPFKVQGCEFGAEGAYNISFRKLRHEREPQCLQLLTALLCAAPKRGKTQPVALSHTQVVKKGRGNYTKSLNLCSPGRGPTSYTLYI